VSTRVRVLVAGLVMVGVIAGAWGAFVWRRPDGSARAAAFAFAPTQSAPAPFDAFSEMRVALDRRCLRVLVAANTIQRNRGLREVRDLGPYDGMLFVFGGDTFARFTMAQTPLPLDIAWYAADGTPVDRTRMTPCPNGTDATCPAYGSRHKYRYALETSAGSLGAGALGGCA
jgi:hypothetical protein